MRYKTSLGLSLVRFEKIALATLAVALMAGCADKTTDQWRRERVSQELAKLQSVTGVYSGDLHSKRDGSFLGGFALELRTDTRVQDSMDRLSSEQRATLRGKIRFSGKFNSELVFDGGDYDSVNRTFRITTPELSVVGSIAGDVVTGEVSPRDYPESASLFNLSKDGAMPDTRDLVQRDPFAPESLHETYTGTYNYSHFGAPATGELTMTVLQNESTPEQQFLNLLLPVRMAKVTCEFQGFHVIFPKARLDERTGTLMAEGEAGEGMQRFPVSLSCQKVQVDNLSAWKCTVSGATKPIVSVLKPVESNEDKKKGDAE